MIVLTNGTGRIFIPDGEVGQVPALLAIGYWEWGKAAEPQAEPVAPVFSVQEHREEIASEPPAAGDDAPQVERVVFSQVGGISDELQQALYDAGYNTWQDILDAGVVKIKDTVAGVGMQRARALFKKAEFEG